MGRWSWSSRYTVEDCLVLGMNDLKRTGLLREGSGSDRVVSWTDCTGQEKAKLQCSLTGFEPRLFDLRLTYKVTNSAGQTQDCDYSIPLVTTPCNFGGIRYWFACPLIVNGRKCARRVGKLYLPPNGIYFGCRHCYNLTYRSCREHDSRMSALAKLPPGELAKLLKSNDPKATLHSLRALLKEFQK